MKPGARVLDMGTGTGILGIIAAKQSGEVVAMDINPYAIRCAKKNTKRNNVDGKMAFLQGDLFSPLVDGTKFDLILFNAPYLPSEKGEENSWLGRAWAGGKSGRDVIERFITKAPSHLEKNGEILLLQSNLTSMEKTIEDFHRVRLESETVTHLDLPFFETLFLIKAGFGELSIS